MDTVNIKENVNLLDLCEKLGIEIQYTGKERAKIKCPNHLKELGREDKKLGNCIASEKSYWCFACHTGGDIFELVKATCDCSFPEAVKVIANLYGFEVDNNIPVDVQPLSRNELELLGLNARATQRLYLYSREQYYRMIRTTIEEKLSRIRECLELYSTPKGEGAGYITSLCKDENEELPPDFFPRLNNELQKLEIAILTAKEKVTF